MAKAFDVMITSPSAVDAARNIIEKKFIAGILLNLKLTKSDYYQC